MRALESLHGRLALLLLLLLGMLWLALLSESQRSAKDRAAQDIDAQLQTAATRLHQLFISVESDLAVEGAEAERVFPVDNGLDGSVNPAYKRPPSFQIALNDGRVLARSSDFPHSARATSPGFEDQASRDRTFRVLTMVSLERGITTRVTLDQATRDARAKSLDLDFRRPLVWLLPLFGMLVLTSVWFGLAPLRNLEKAVVNQQPDSLGGLDIGNKRLPRELGSLVTVIENLLAKISDFVNGQRRFTAAAAHELRTPLAGCKIQLQVAQRTSDSEVQDRAHVQALQSVATMQQLIDQLLMLARANAESSTVRKSPIELVSLTRKVSLSREAMATEAEVTLHFNSTLDSVSVFGNQTLLESMIGNLLDNAIKFSPRSGVVILSLVMRAEMVELCVRDFGPGVPEAERRRVFDQFYQIQSSVQAGSGLGLTIVQAIASVHGASVRIDEASGGGTVVIVAIPAALHSSVGSSINPNPAGGV